RRRRRKIGEMTTPKFVFKSVHTDEVIESSAEWFRLGQQFPSGAKVANVEYPDGYGVLPELLMNSSELRNDMWRYFDLMPIANRDNIVTNGEGAPPIHRWKFLEDYARRLGISCTIYAHRWDDSYSTGTWKDLSGALVASGLKESGVTDYVAASTGNIGVSLSCYLTKAGIAFYAFIPESSSFAQEAELGVFGQAVYRVNGDYTCAKNMAAKFAEVHGYALTAGTFDPFRIEAKKTMAFEWARVLPQAPTVYVQALSGGTGPIGVAKGCRELQAAALLEHLPRLLLVQSDRCAPMAQGWEAAVSDGFPDGWEKRFPVIESPETEIATLATGNPAAYPLLAPVVRETGGHIFSVREEFAMEIAKLVAAETSVRIGPAAAIGVQGLFAALRSGRISDGDVVVLNVGEGMRRSPGFMRSLVRKAGVVEDLADCEPFDRKSYIRRLWERVAAEFDPAD
ncbi:MAG: pyridoxal-phosphate dependent enzyme, partial [Alphaproteobacteria bacterium]